MRSPRGRGSQPATLSVPASSRPASAHLRTRSVRRPSLDPRDARPRSRTRAARWVLDGKRGSFPAVVPRETTLEPSGLPVARTSRSRLRNTPTARSANPTLAAHPPDRARPGERPALRAQGAVPRRSPPPRWWTSTTPATPHALDRRWRSEYPDGPAHVDRRARGGRPGGAARSAFSRPPCGIRTRPGAATQGQDRRWHFRLRPTVPARVSGARPRRPAPAPAPAGQVPHPDREQRNMAGTAAGTSSSVRQSRLGLYGAGPGVTRSHFKHRPTIPALGIRYRARGDPLAGPASGVQAPHPTESGDAGPGPPLALQHRATVAAWVPGVASTRRGWHGPSPSPQAEPEPERPSPTTCAEGPGRSVP